VRRSRKFTPRRGPSYLLDRFSKSEQLARPAKKKSLVALAENIFSGMHACDVACPRQGSKKTDEDKPADPDTSDAGEEKDDSAGVRMSIRGEE